MEASFNEKVIGLGQLPSSAACGIVPLYDAGGSARSERRQERWNGYMERLGEISQGIESAIKAGDEDQLDTTLARLESLLQRMSTDRDGDGVPDEYDKYLGKTVATVAAMKNKVGAFAETKHTEKLNKLISALKSVTSLWDKLSAAADTMASFGLGNKKKDGDEDGALFGLGSKKKSDDGVGGILGGGLDA
jgi:hypothetical protein